MANGYYRSEANRLQGITGSQSAATTRPGEAAGAGFGSMAGAGFWLQIGGSVMESVGAYYAARNRQYDLKSQALAFEFEQTMAAVNARQAEAVAQSIIEAGAQEASLTGLRYAQERSSARVSQGARGIAIGVGSAAEEDASIRYAEESDRLTINANAVRQAGQARLQATEQRNRGALAGVSAGNARTSARSVNPGLAAGSTILGSAGNIARQGAYDRRYRRS